ncbi:hypothetical protein CSUB01_09922 [Colletotrichum sublineola]|uniref:Uncharacterized protein n=1 Tax=Colletotrichum sublineola TaxID=1173701 RepID=A0A066XCG6_COLSU|nr:hypothetical protein CSUB01_09922 [Colletotrichum sublineola]
MQFLLPILTLAGAAFAGVISRDGPSNVPVGNPPEGSLEAITHLFHLGNCPELWFCGDDAPIQKRQRAVNANLGIFAIADNLFNGWNDVISSLGPDAGTTCTIWAGASIGGIINPGIFNLADSQWNFNDKSTPSEESSLSLCSDERFVQPPNQEPGLQVASQQKSD